MTDEEYEQAIRLMRDPSFTFTDGIQYGARGVDLTGCRDSYIEPPRFGWSQFVSIQSPRTTAKQQVMPDQMTWADAYGRYADIL